MVTLTVRDDNPGRARAEVRRLMYAFVNGKVTRDGLHDEALYIQNAVVAEVVE